MLSRYGGGEEHKFVAEFYDLVYENRGLRDIDFFTDDSKRAVGRTLEVSYYAAKK